MGCGCKDQRKKVINAVSNGQPLKAFGHIGTGAGMIAGNVVTGAKAKLPFVRK